ncbi:hypothetical protein evm_003017 [Chilo suppressalis]|nr:hypothetical protein evm_003017 [Chilo suppressalis]
MLKLNFFSLILWITFCTLLIQIPKAVARTNEFGKRVKGDELSFKYYTTIPRFQGSFSVNMTHDKPHLEQRYTYVKVDFINVFSKILMDFNFKKNMLYIELRFPLISTQLAVYGYSLPKNASTG